MNNKEQKQLLSAYFDNEVTPEERAEIERLLESSTDSRQSLEEMDQLSGLIRSLPKQKAPETLSAMVMQQAEREMLLSMPSTSTSNPSTGGKRSWGIWVGGLVATTAMLFIVAHFIPLQNSNQDPNNHAVTMDGGNSSDFDNLEIVMDDESGTSATPAESPGFAGEQSVVSNGDYLKSANVKSKKTVSKPFAPQSVTMKKSDSSNSKGGGGFVGQGRMSIASKNNDFRSIDWNKVEVGEIFSYNDKSGDQVTVIEVTVVDVQKALGEMQLLLARNDIPKATGIQLNKMTTEKVESDGNTETFKTKKPKATAKTQIEKKFTPRPALFVEASEIQIVATLTALQKRDMFLDVQPQETQVASVDINHQLANLNWVSQRQLRYRRRSKVSPRKKFNQSTHVFAPSNTKNNGLAQSDPLKPAKKEREGSSLADKSDVNTKKTDTKRVYRESTANSYQMIVNVNKLAPQLVEKEDQKDKNKDEEETPLLAASQMKKDEIKERGMKRDKKDRSAQEEKVASKGTPPRANQLSGKKAGVKMRDGNVDSVTQSTARSSQPVRLLFVFSRRSTPMQKAAMPLK